MIIKICLIYLLLYYVSFMIYSLIMPLESILNMAFFIHSNTIHLLSVYLIFAYLFNLGIVYTQVEMCFMFYMSIIFLFLQIIHRNFSRYGFTLSNYPWIVYTTIIYNYILVFFLIVMNDQTNYNNYYKTCIISGSHTLLHLFWVYIPISNNST